MRDRQSLKYVGIIFWIMLSIYVSSDAAQGARFNWDRYKSRSDAWYQSQEGKRTAKNILSFQDEYGAWPKNIDTAAEPNLDSKKVEGTFDNAATTGEMRFMARAFAVTGDVQYKTAFIKALDLILKAQYPTGGWPQHYPPGKGYARCITFNDGTMVRIMEMLSEISSTSDYGFVDAGRRTSCQKAYDRGIECILKCQIRVDGKLTVWCAQHDEIDYSPRPARSYELVSLSGGESVDILHTLMSVEPPTPEIIEAIKAGVQWYHISKVSGIRLDKIDGESRAVEDPVAEPIWARFYEITTNRPFFCDRDGVVKYDYNLIDKERRNGYSWYGDYGQDVFGDYEKWSRRWEYLLLPEGTKIMAIIGDSTVCNYPNEGVRRGWGQYIQDYFDDPIKVYNCAKSGRSTKTFIKEGLWAQTLALKPAYVLIQFGHNDSHAPERPESTDAASDYQDYLRQYIDESRQIGAIPILVTPMYRRKFDDVGRIRDNLLPYADAMKKVAEEKKVPLVDLNSASERLYLQLGPEGALEFANAPDDQTHFNEKGARAMAELVMQQLPQAESSLKQYLKQKND